MTINRGIHIEGVAYIYNGILLSHKKKQIVPFAEVWIDLETYSEVSQQEKNKYCTLTHIYGIYKNGTDEPI